MNKIYSSTCFENGFLTNIKMNKFQVLLKRQSSNITINFDMRKHVVINRNYVYFLIQYTPMGLSRGRGNLFHLANAQLNIIVIGELIRPFIQVPTY